MDTEPPATERPELREGARAGRLEDHPDDLLKVLLIEHADVLERRRLVQSVNPDIEIGVCDYPRKPPHPDENDPIAPYLERAHECDLTALCLSGGGIRSAAFALGVMQGLAKHQLLDKFDRLSTVSGGGYIGSWLTTWVQRSGYLDVLRGIPSNRSPNRRSPLVHLWRYSRYLAPRAGLLSTDALSLVALFVRNLLLNWLILLPILVLGIVAVKALAIISWSIPTDWVGMLVALATMFVGVALLDSLLQRPGWEARSRSVIPFAAAELIPMIMGAICASMAALASYSALGSHGLRANSVGSFIAAGSMLAALAWLFAFYFASLSPTTDQVVSVATSLSQAARRRSVKKHVVMAAFAFVGSGAVVGAALAAIVRSIVAPLNDDSVLAFITLGPMIALLLLFAGELLYTGLTSYAPWGDAEREWLARSGGRHALAAVVWGLSVGTVLFGSVAVFEVENVKAGVFSVAASGGVAGTIIALLGKAPRTTAVIQDTVRKTLADYSIPVVLAVAMPVFGISVVSLISWTIDKSILTKPLLPSSVLGSEVLVWKHFAAISGVCFLVAWLFSLIVNINRFSLHGVYRNRLVRTFLGASNFDRKPNSDTDFDDRDNISMHELWPEAPATQPGPPPQLLYINMSLNVLRGRELAWQERKALPYVATARYVGCASMPWVDCTNAQRFGCFRKAREYARGRRNDPEAKGLTLGTAMTLSGAAASPNMGYHSSPALSLLLTMFNVRLGGWFANPGPAGAAKTHRSGPTVAAWPLIQEALGLTNEQREYVYLSDGGHFENLGAYEMIRRRCRYIVVSDAGCDVGHTFADLGNLVRKASIDFGVQFRFVGLDGLRSRGKSRSPNDPVGVVADIIYPELTDHPGRLLYIKPGYHGGEPPSVRSYGELHPEFPHESTADQFFGESQFEAYRALGEHCLESLTGSRQFHPGSIASFMAAASENLRSKS